MFLEFKWFIKLHQAFWFLCLISYSESVNYFRKKFHLRCLTGNTPLIIQSSFSPASSFIYCKCSSKVAQFNSIYKKKTISETAFFIITWVAVHGNGLNSNLFPDKKLTVAFYRHFKSLLRIKSNTKGILFLFPAVQYVTVFTYCNPFWESFLLF